MTTKVPSVCRGSNLGLGKADSHTGRPREEEDSPQKGQQIRSEVVVACDQAIHLLHKQTWAVQTYQLPQLSDGPTAGSVA